MEHKFAKVGRPAGGVAGHATSAGRASAWTKNDEAPVGAPSARGQTPIGVLSSGHAYTVARQKRMPGASLGAPGSSHWGEPPCRGDPPALFILSSPYPFRRGPQRVPSNVDAPRYFSIATLGVEWASPIGRLWTSFVDRTESLVRADFSMNL